MNQSLFSLYCRLFHRTARGYFWQFFGFLMSLFEDSVVGAEEANFAKEHILNICKCIVIAIIKMKNTMT